MAKNAVETQNNCRIHGNYPAPSAMTPCPKCDKPKRAAVTAQPDRLGQLEVVIGEAIARVTREFKVAGGALREIRDSRLYRETHANFDDYCEERWGFTRSRAHRLIEGSEIAELLPTGQQPTNERQARELVPVLKTNGPEAVREVWEEAGPKPTAKKIRAAVQQRLGSGEVEPACTHPRKKCADCGKVIGA